MIRHSCILRLLLLVGTLSGCSKAPSPETLFSSHTLVGRELVVQITGFRNLSAGRDSSYCWELRHEREDALRMIGRHKFRPCDIGDALFIRATVSEAFPESKNYIDSFSAFRTDDDYWLVAPASTSSFYLRVP
jgi:hypothetical protein